MSNQRYPEEFKIQAVNQVTKKPPPISKETARLGVSVRSLYAWIKLVRFLILASHMKPDTKQGIDF